MEGQYQRALKILTENKVKLELLAEKLLIDEVIFKENLEEIFGKRPWDPAELIEDKESSSKDSASENEQIVSSEASPSEENQPEDPTENSTPPKNESETTEE